MPRLNTQLECTGAEFLVLGNLLLLGIPSYRSYTNTRGYDLVATNPEEGLAARIQVKSRWRTRPEGFIIKNFECDFVVIVLLNRGSKDGTAEVKPPEYFILPVEMVRRVPRSTGWGKISFSKIDQFSNYRDRWNDIRDFLRISPTQ